MKSCFVELTDIGRSHLNEEEISERELADNEALVKADYSMISAGTELSRAFALKKGFQYPVRPGYSLTGTVLAKGKKIRAEVGDKVFVNATHASLVRHSDGDLIQGPWIMKLPDDIDLKEATALNLLLVAIQGVNLTEVKLGYTAGVYGLGNIGIMTALLYQKLGCQVIGFDPVEERCRLAEQMGVQYTAANAAKEKISDLTQGNGLDIAVDVTGFSSVVMDCIDKVRAYGQVLLLGSPRESYECDITAAFRQIHMKDLKVLGGFNRNQPVHPKDGSIDSLENNFRIACDLIKTKQIDVSRLISRVIDPKDCQQAYQDLMDHKANCIIYDWRSY